MKVGGHVGHVINCSRFFADQNSDLKIGLPNDRAQLTGAVGTVRANAPD